MAQKSLVTSSWSRMIKSQWWSLPASLHYSAGASSSPRGVDGGLAHDHHGPSHRMLPCRLEDVIGAPHVDREGEVGGHPVGDRDREVDDGVGRAHGGGDVDEGGYVADNGAPFPPCRGAPSPARGRSHAITSCPACCPAATIAAAVEPVAPVMGTRPALSPRTRSGSTFRRWAGGRAHGASGGAP